MARVGDCFLTDLEDLSDNEGENISNRDIQCSKDEDHVVAISKLKNTKRYNDIIQKIETVLQKGYDEISDVSESAENPEYQLIVDCTDLSAEIDDEIIRLHNLVRDRYNNKFPELESLVQHPIDYARVVKKIGNETDLTLVDLTDLLPSSVIMVVSITGSTTMGKPLSEDVLQMTIKACDSILELEFSRNKIIEFMERRMRCIAPNLSAIVGSCVAAKLVVAAGGLKDLQNMPACNVKCLGAKKGNLAGFSTATNLSRIGFIAEAELFKGGVDAGLLADKSILAARVDFQGSDSTGERGRKWREEIERKTEKRREKPPPRIPKPLPVPDFEKKKRRAGVRARKAKERYGLTDTKRLMNRVQFGVPEESSLGDGFGEGYGMLGQAGSGKVRVPTGSTSRLKVNRKLNQKHYGNGGANPSGLISSFAFTPVQGIELANPQGEASQLASGTQTTYFSEIGTFSRISRT